jgi:arylsulfatase A-like enzyme
MTKAIVKTLLAGAIVVHAFGKTEGAQETAAERPNILFIYTDDQSYRTVSCYPQDQQTVSALDEAVGTLLAALDETEQRENTLIVFTSDQGLAVGQHGFLDKHAPYDATIASPLIFSLPGVLPQGSLCDRPVGGVDLVPTFFRFAGIDLPWEMHGRDLTPLLKDPNRAWPYPVLLTYTVSRFGDDTAVIPVRRGRPDRVPWYVLLRQGRHKYIRTLVAGEVEELYDLETDPEELVNLALDVRHRDDVVAHRRSALSELERIQAPLVDHFRKLVGETSDE